MMILANRKLKFLMAFLLVAPILGCAGGKKLVLTAKALGTDLRVEFHQPKDYVAKGDPIDTQIGLLMDRFDESMSTYREDSQISKFNKSDSTAPFEIGRVFYEILVKSLDYGRKTDGALDITVYNLSKVWGFGSDWKIENNKPEPKEFNKAVSVTGYWNIRVFEKDGKYYVSKKIPGVQIDVSSIAKGYAVDKIAELLEENGIEVYFIDLGGEIRAGKAYRVDEYSRQLWKVGVEKPIKGYDRIVMSTLNLEYLSVATSGVYRNANNIEGKEIPHLIDPRKGHPVENTIKSVTVIAADCAEADAYATALTIMGKRKALLFAEKNNIAVYIITLENGKYVESMSHPYRKIAGLKEDK